MVGVWKKLPVKETCGMMQWSVVVVGNFSIIHFMFLMAASEVARVNKTWGEELDLQFCCPIEYFQQWNTFWEADGLKALLKQTRERNNQNLRDYGPLLILPLWHLLFILRRNFLHQPLNPCFRLSDLSTHWNTENLKIFFRDETYHFHWSFLWQALKDPSKEITVKHSTDWSNKLNHADSIRVHSTVPQYLL